MSDEKKYTQRELVLAQREAFIAGIRDAQAFGRAVYGWNEQGRSLRAARRYPLPRVTSPGHGW